MSEELLQDLALYKILEVKIFNSHNQSLQLINKFILGFQISIYVGVALGDSWISPKHFVVKKL
ncbi:hypothetical protein CsatB_025592 [Cannabis sativa]